MATVNIRRDVKDSFYRYKMPKLISKVSQECTFIVGICLLQYQVAKQFCLWLIRLRVKETVSRPSSLTWLTLQDHFLALQLVSSLS